MELCDAQCYVMSVICQCGDVACMYARICLFVYYVGLCICACVCFLRTITKTRLGIVNARTDSRVWSYMFERTVSAAFTSNDIYSRQPRSVSRSINLAAAPQALSEVV